MELPAYRGKEKVIVPGRQSVKQIIAEIENAHLFFAKDYDAIAVRFIGDSDTRTLENIFNFLKLNVRYEEEPEKLQVSKSPAAIIETGVCDCKCYALFIGGVLGALNRKGSGIEWNYVFASYKNTTTPGHVFVQAFADGAEYWVDPVLPRFNQRTPVPTYTTRKKVNDMLVRLSGIPDSPAGHMPANMRGFDRSLGAGAAEPPKTTSGAVEWIKKNPLIVAAGAVLLAYMLSKKRRGK